MEEYNIYRPEQNNNGKEMLEELNSDSPELDGFSKIDMRTRLGMYEIPAIMCVDFCISMNALPSELSRLTKSKKRLAVSLNGKGREEMVQIIKAEKEAEAKTSMIDKQNS